MHGYIRVVHVPKYDADMYVNEEGRMIGTIFAPPLDLNVKATCILATGQAGIWANDYIVGDVVLLGTCNEGEPTDVPESVINLPVFSLLSQEQI